MHNFSNIQLLCSHGPLNEHYVLNNVMMDFSNHVACTVAVMAHTSHH